MNLAFRKFTGMITAAVAALSLMAGTVPAMAADGDTSAVYEFNAADIETFDADKARTYGFEFDNTATGYVWSPTKVEDKYSVYQPSVRFSTRNLSTYHNGQGEFLKHVFADDTVNPPSDDLTGGKYIYETEAAILYYNQGYMEISFNGIGTDGIEQSFATMQISYSGSTSTNNGTAKFVDADGNTIGSVSEAFQMNNLAANNNQAGCAATLQYIRAEFDFDNNTFSAWIAPRAVCEGGYTPVQASDDNKIVDNQPLNISDIAQFTSVSYNITQSNSTNGIWLKYVGITPAESQDPGSESTPNPTPSGEPVTTPSAEPSAAPTATISPSLDPSLGKLIDTEDFSGKSVVNNSVSGWNFYDKTEPVSSLPNVMLSINNNALTITKTGTAGETDYAERYKSMYRLRETLEEYSDDTRTETYATDLTGKFRIETSILAHVQRGSQFMVVNPAFGEQGSVPDRVYPMSIDSSGVYEYISSDNKPSIYSTSILDSNATITYDIDTDAGEFTTYVNDGDGYTKTFAAGTPLQGIMYILKSKAAVNDYIRINNIKLYRLDGSSSQNEAYETSKSLVMSDITETPENVVSNVTLPDTLDGATVEWTSSQPSIIDNGGVLIERPIDKSADVVLTAKITKNDSIVYKDFHITVSVMEISDFEVIDDVDFADSDNVIITDNGGSHEFDGETLKLIRTSSSQTPQANIYPVWGDKRFQGCGLMMFEADVSMPSSYQKGEIVLYDTNGQRITSFYTTRVLESGKPTGTTLTAVARESMTGEEVHKAINSGTTEAISMKIRTIFNTNTKIMSVYIALNGSDTYTTVFENAYMRENAENLSHIQITANSDNNQGSPTLYGTLSVNSVKLYTMSDNRLNIALNSMNYYGPVETVGEYVTSDIKLNTDAYEGTTVEWISSNPAILSNDGKLDKTAYSEDTPITLSFRLSLDGTSFYVERTFDLTAVYIDMNNLAINATADTGNIQPMPGHAVSKAIDGSISTYWQTVRFDALPALTVTLNREEVLKNIVIYEAPMMDAYPITGWIVETSRDGKNYTTAAEGTSLGENAVEIALDNVIAKYVRFRVTSKDENSCCGLRELQIYSGRNDAEKAEADIIMAMDSVGSLLNMSSDKDFVKTGPLYGSSMTYESSDPEHFSNTGDVTSDSQLRSGTLTVSAELNGQKATKEYPFSVAKQYNTSTGGTGGSGGGTGSSSGGSGGSGLPAGVVRPTSSPRPTEDTPAGTFNDVQEDFWAYEFIESLTADGVVSGDEQKNFRPGDNVSRQEFVKMLLLALDVDLSGAADPGFYDVTDSDWSYSYIAKAVELGIVTGVSEAEFDKNSPITREDMAVMCTRALKSIGDYTEPGEGAVFGDIQDVSDYAASAVAAMSERGVINGYDDNTFRPKNNATRAEAAKIIYMLTK